MNKIIKVPVVEMIGNDNVFAYSYFAGTNGFQGGDSGHGGRAIIGISNRGGMDLRVQTDRKDDTISCDPVRDISIVVGGDDEIKALSGMLRDMAKILESQIEGKQENNIRKDIKLHHSPHDTCYATTVKLNGW